MPTFTASCSAAIVLLFTASYAQAQTAAVADSLLREYERLWKASDSIRIHAMLLRMEAARTRKAVSAANDDILADLQSRARAERSRTKLATAKPGVSVADSVTLDNLRFTPDTGTASFYANEFHGRPTSSGERYNMNDLTCAHRWLPFGTRVRITNLDNGRSVVARVNDRGPWKHGRIVDVSKAAAAQLDFVRRGTTTVVVEIAPETPPTILPDSTSTGTEP